MFVVDRRATGEEINFRLIGAAPGWRMLAARVGAAETKVISGRLLRLVKARARDMVKMVVVEEDGPKIEQIDAR